MAPWDDAGWRGDGAVAMAPWESVFLAESASTPHALVALAEVRSERE
jgi:hypothetical protein